MKSPNKMDAKSEGDSKPEVAPPAQVDPPAPPADGEPVGSETDKEPETGSEPDKVAGTTVTDGVRARRGLTMKNLIPDRDWINKNVVAGGKGTRATVGRIFGVATGSVRRTNDVAGTPVESIAVGGMFNAESYVTGELSEGTSCYFPMAYAEKIEALFKADATIKVIEVDCDVGLEATGKTIPYEWVIVAYREGQEMAVLKRLRAARQRPANLLISAAGQPLQLTAPAK